MGYIGMEALMCRSSVLGDNYTLVAEGGRELGDVTVPSEG